MDHSVSSSLQHDILENMLNHVLCIQVYTDIITQKLTVHSITFWIFVAAISGSMVGAPRNCACRSLSSCCLWYNIYCTKISTTTELAQQQNFNQKGQYHAKTIQGNHVPQDIARVLHNLQFDYGLKTSVMRYLKRVQPESTIS